MQNQTLNWYGVKLLYINQVVGDLDTSLVDKNFIKNYIAYEESIVVVQADSFDIAYEKAEQLARENDDDYQNIYGQRVIVRLHDSIDCYLIDEVEGMNLQDGVEVYSRIIESRSTENQEAFLKQLYPISDRPNYMLLNKEFSRSKPNNVL